MRSKGQLLPHPLWIAAQQVGYLMPWYNPLHEANTEDAIAYLDNSPAAKRAESTGKHAAA